MRSAVSINSMYSRTLVGDEIVMWSSAETTIGWLGAWGDVHPDLKRLHDRQYTRLIPDQFGSDTHEYHRHRVLLRELGHEQEGDLRPGLWEIPSFGSLTIPIHDLVESGKFAIVVPGADARIRRWPFSSFLELTRMISDRFPELKIVLLGTTEEKHLGGIDGSPTFPAQVLDLRGKTALLDIPVIINSARLVIGNETGPIHLAIALGIPSVAIVGGGHYGRFMPYGEPTTHRTVTNYLDCFHCDWHCSRKVPECIIDVPVSQVWKELVNMLERMGMPFA
jgi:ADP-heptose:LPS heptosyltransferase